MSTVSGVPGDNPSTETSRLGEALTRARVYGWMPLVALATTVAIESGERLSLAQAAKGIKAEFHVTDTELAVLPAAMALVGVLGAFPFGILADRTRRTALLAGGVAIWTVCMGLNGLATTYAMLFLFRLGVGAVEANGPAAVSLVSDYYPVRIRAKVMGLYQSGALFGALVGLVVGGVVVDAYGWRWAFFMWVPAGAVVALFMLRQPEPARGDQDVDYQDELAEGLPGGAEATEFVRRAELPPPTRLGTLDPATATPKEVYRELLKIRSMWLGVMALTISSILLNGLQFWGVEYYKRIHDLTAAEAGLYTGLFGLGAAVGIVAGGYLADHLLRRGIINARVYVVAFSSIAASLVLTPAFLSTSLTVAAPLMVLGGALLTVPVAPSEAMVTDVVVAQLRGRAATMRSVVRSLGAFGYVLIGALSDIWDLRIAIALVTPLYAVGGVLMLYAARTYPADLSFVLAESRRLGADRGDDGKDDSRVSERPT